MVSKAYILIILFDLTNLDIILPTLTIKQTLLWYNFNLNKISVNIIYVYKWT